MSHQSGSMHVLGVMGSPRRGGNTEILVDEILKGAAESGASVEKVLLGELKIRPCLGCNICMKTGKCVQEDDMAAILEKMNRSQVWVLGTPVYWWGPTAQMKSFIDRWYGGVRSIAFQGRRVILAVPLGDTDEKTARHTIGMMEDSLEYLKMNLFASIIACGVYEKGDVRACTDILATAKNAGKDAVTEPLWSK
jgi:multimeric flavodoxin WrbA